MGASIQCMCIKETNEFILNFQNAACGFSNSVFLSLLLFGISPRTVLVVGLGFQTIDFEGLSFFLFFFFFKFPNIYALKVKRTNSSRK